MCERILEGRKRKTKNEEDEAMGFGDFGSYFDAKKSKLVDQFKALSTTTELKSNIFQGVYIFVNGFTNPNAAELRKLMAEHGGVFHGYQMSSTTHIIASNLAYAKTKNLGSVPIVKPSWITDSIELKKLLDYKRYLLFTNQSAAQPKLNFPVLSDVNILENSESKVDEELADFGTSKENLGCSSSDFVINENFSETLKGANEVSEPRVKSANEIGKSRISKTASDPQFLEEFYNNSRLHLISTMGAEFKQLVGQLRERSDGKFPGKELLLLKGNSDCKRTYSSVIMHIDMDCFFVSVGLRNRPDLKGKPVAVTHARNGQISSSRPGRSVEIAMNLERAPENIVEKISNLDSHSSMSEIACCSYEARKCGIKNGMFLGTAIKYCPNLKTIQYDFQGYKDVAAILYKTIASYTLDIEAVSCDEMYVDITKLLNESGLTVDQFATHLRSEIMEKTQCPCSTGFGANKLQARLATKKAKPNGQFYLEVDDVESHFAEIVLGDLPGVGRATLSKLRNLGLNTCGDVQMASLSLLQTELGQKIGETLLEQAKGIDRKPLNFHQERKSVSAEINYGIRFKTQEESYNFLQSLSQEVFNRMNDINMRAKCLTLKLMVRASDAPVETAKFLGHGICDSLSKSITSNAPIGDMQTIYREAKQLYDRFNVPYADLRGVGIQLSKLEKIGPANSVMSNFLKQSMNKKDSDGIKSQGTIGNKKIPVISGKKPNQITEAQVSRELPSKKSVEKVSPRSNTSNPKLNGTKSKRGRPSGSRSKVKSNNKNKPSPSPMLDKYLKNMGGTPTKVDTILNNIDINVLYELPEEIRNEILKEYKLQQSIPPKKRQDQEKEKMLDGKSINPESNRTEEKIQPNKSLFDGLSWEELKPVLKAWMTSEAKPKKVDVEMISTHFRQLAIDRKIEFLKVVFNFLHRSFSKMNCEWHEAYFEIVNTTQQGMVARYGGTLLVQRKFECCW